MEEKNVELNVDELEQVSGGKIRKKITKEEKAAEHMRRNNERSEMLARETQRRQEAKLADFEL